MNAFALSAIQSHYISHTLCLSKQSIQWCVYTLFDLEIALLRTLTSLPRRSFRAPSPWQKPIALSSHIFQLIIATRNGLYLVSGRFSGPNGKWAPSQSPYWSIFPLINWQIYNFGVRILPSKMKWFAKSWFYTGKGLHHRKCGAQSWICLCVSCLPMITQVCMQLSLYIYRCTFYWKNTTLLKCHWVLAILVKLVSFAVLINRQFLVFVVYNLCWGKHSQFDFPRSLRQSSDSATDFCMIICAHENGHSFRELTSGVSRWLDSFLYSCSTVSMVRNHNVCALSLWPNRHLTFGQCVIGLLWSLLRQSLGSFVPG